MATHPRPGRRHARRRPRARRPRAGQPARPAPGPLRTSARPYVASTRLRRARLAATRTPRDADPASSRAARRDRGRRSRPTSRPPAPRSPSAGDRHRRWPASTGSSTSTRLSAVELLLERRERAPSCRAAARASGSRSTTSSSARWLRARSGPRGARHERHRRHRPGSRRSRPSSPLLPRCARPWPAPSAASPARLAGGHRCDAAGGRPPRSARPARSPASRSCAEARKMVGLPYVWGGTDPETRRRLLRAGAGRLREPSASTCRGVSADQATRRHRGRRAWPRPMPGDLIAWDNSSRNVGADHIAIYIGNGKMIEAPRPGGHVQVVPRDRRRPTTSAAIIPEGGGAPASSAAAVATHHRRPPAAPPARRTPTSSSRAGATHGVDPALLAAVARQESGFDPRAVSPAGAQGLMQLMPGTAQGLGVANSFDPAQAVDGAARLLDDLMSRFGRSTSRSRPTTPGPGAVLPLRRHPALPRDAQHYVRSVMATLAGSRMTHHLAPPHRGPRPSAVAARRCGRLAGLRRRGAGAASPRWSHGCSPTRPSGRPPPAEALAGPRRPDRRRPRQAAAAGPARRTLRRTRTAAAGPVADPAAEAGVPAEVAPAGRCRPLRLATARDRCSGRRPVDPVPAAATPRCRRPAAGAAPTGAGRRRRSAPPAAAGAPTRPTAGRRHDPRAHPSARRPRPTSPQAGEPTVADAGPVGPPAPRGRHRQPAGPRARPPPRRATGRRSPAGTAPAATPSPPRPPPLRHRRHHRRTRPVRSPARSCPRSTGWSAAATACHRLTMQAPARGARRGPGDPHASATARCTCGMTGGEDAAAALPRARPSCGASSSSPARASAGRRAGPRPAAPGSPGLPAARRPAHQEASDGAGRARRLPPGPRRTAGQQDHTHGRAVAQQPGTASPTERPVAPSRPGHACPRGAST